MRLFKCVSCDFMCNKEVFTCPYCNSAGPIVITDSYTEEEILYSITMEDVEMVIEDLELQEFIDDKKISDEAIKDCIRRKMDIPWTEYIEDSIKARFDYYEWLKSKDDNDFEENCETSKPTCKLTGENGNIFNLISIVKNTLNQHGLNEEAKEMQSRVFASGSYDEALAIFSEYVDIE